MWSRIEEGNALEIGRSVEAGGSVLTVRVTGEDTGGRWSLTDVTLPPRFVEAAPPPHMHTREEEGFFVTEGEVAILRGDVGVVAPAGSFVLSRRGELHSFSNPADHPARLLILASPAGLENFLVELYEQLRANPEDVGKILALFEAYGMTVLPQPA